MAEKDASLAVENAVLQLKQEAGTLEKVHKMNSLRSELRSVSLLLRELNGQENEPKVEEQLQKVRDIAYEAQDEIESIVQETERHERKGKLGKMFSRKNTIKQHLETIEDIEKRIQSIPSFNDGVESTEVPEFDPNPDVSGNLMVNIREYQQGLVREQLGSGGPQCQVLVIFGEAGLGKTTLARMVYHNSHIDDFNCHMWVGMPQQVQVGAKWRVSRRTGKSTHKDCQMNDDQLHKSLKRNKYLIVLDNLCNSEIFDSIMSSLPDDSNGSRILITSRLEPSSLGLNNNVWSYQLEPLNMSQSWQLLSDQVFQGCAPNLEDLGKRMADTCRGSPSAIMTLAKILNQADKTEETWAKFLQDLNQGQIWENQDLLKDPCFLYLGLFPSDSDIPAKQIIQMWAAEGLLQHKGNIVAEKTGEEYLKELSKRSFIQESTTKTGDDALVKTYRISYFMSNLCRKIGENKLSLQVRNYRNAEHGVGAQIIRLGIPNTAIQVLKSCNRAPRLRSLYSFGEGIELISSSLWKTLHSKFPSLRVLNMGSLKLERVPKEIGELFHLRYLRLVAPGVSHLPSSFGNLHNLETLDMRESQLHGRLHGIWKMKHLRHIYLGHFSMPDPNSIDYYKVLQNLQTVSGVHPDRILKRLMVRAKFPNIKRLRLCSLDQEGAFSFLNSLDHLYYLQSLRIEKTTKIPDDPNAFPLSLSKITLLETYLKPICIEKIEKLPNLKVLKLLKDSIIGKKIVCTSDGFPQLEVLYLDGLVVEKLTLSEGMMSRLKRFYIKECPKLTVPIALEEKVVRLRAK